MAEKINNTTLSYVFGVISIVFAFFNPFAGLIFGIIGFRKGKQAKSKEGRKLNIWGMTLSAILLAVSIALLVYSLLTGGLNAGNFPI